MDFNVTTGYGYILDAQGNYLGKYDGFSIGTHSGFPDGSTIVEVPIKNALHIVGMQPAHGWQHMGRIDADMDAPEVAEATSNVAGKSSMADITPSLEDSVAALETWRATLGA